MKRILIFIISISVFASSAFGINSFADDYDFIDTLALQQYDDAWCDTTVGVADFGITGCSIMAVVNIVRFISGSFIDPIELANAAYSDGVYNYTNIGTYVSSFSSKLKNENSNSYSVLSNANCEVKLGYTSIKDPSYMIPYIQAGYGCLFSIPGHSMSAVRYDYSTDKYFVLDSSRNPSRGTSEYGTWVTCEQLCEMKFLSFLAIGLKSGFPASVSVPAADAQFIDIPQALFDETVISEKPESNRFYIEGSVFYAQSFVSEYPMAGFNDLSFVSENKSSRINISVYKYNKSVENSLKYIPVLDMYYGSHTPSGGLVLFDRLLPSGKYVVKISYPDCVLDSSGLQAESGHAVSLLLNSLVYSDSQVYAPDSRSNDALNNGKNGLLFSLHSPYTSLGSSGKIKIKGSKIKPDYIICVNQGVLYRDLIEAYGDEIILKDTNDSECSTDTLLATGMTALYNEDEYRVIVNGDVSGDGQVNIFDVSSLFGHLLNNNLRDDFIEAGLFADNYDNVNIIDVLLLLNSI